MVSAVQWLAAETESKPRVVDVFGADAVLRADVVDTLIRRIAPDEVTRFRVGSDVGEVSDAVVWDAVATVPLAGVSSRMVIVDNAARLKNWHRLDLFIDNRVQFAETVLVLVSDRERQGVAKRERTQIPGKYVTTIELLAWEQRIKDYSGGAFIICSTPSIERNKDNPLSPAARWLSMRCQVTQKQAELVWQRSGGSSALARDVISHIAMVEGRDVSRMPLGEFRKVVASVLSQHGAEDFADMLLFDKRQLALASLNDRSFTSAEWSKIIGFLGQRLDWLDPLHEALRTNENLSQVMKRINIPQNYILHYAHREDPTHNVAKNFNRQRVLRLRRLLAEYDAYLHNFAGVPPGFGEALVASW